MAEKTKKKDVFSLKRALANLKTLTVMQLKEKMDVAFLRSFKQTLFRVIFFILEFVIITAVCFLLFYLAQFLKVFDAINGKIPANILTTVVAVMLGLSVIFTTLGLVQSLYLSKDNLVLLTFPAKPTMVFLSKLLVYYVYELKKNFMFLIPLFCGYGLALGYPVYYFFWVIVLFAFVAMLPVLVAALLSMPALFIFQFIRKYKLAQYCLYLLIYAGIFALVLLLLKNLPDEINFLRTGIPTDAINRLTANVANGFPPVAWLTRLLVGEPYSVVTVNGIFTTTPKLFISSTLPLLAGTIGAIALLLGLGLLLAQPLFYKMASKPFEFAKKMRIKPKNNVKSPVFLSAIKKEWMMALRDGTITALITQLVVIMPLAIAVLNGLYNAMNKDLTGVQMTVAFNLLIVMLFMFSANIRLSSAYSKEGFAARMNKVQPSAHGSRLLFSKLTVNMAMGLVGIIVTTIVYSLYYQVGSVNLWLFGGTAYFAYIAHLFWSGELDLMNPQYDQYATFSEQSNNPNENKSTILAFALAFAYALFIFLLIGEGVNKTWTKALILSIAFAAFRIFTYFLKIRVYYKEK